MAASRNNSDLHKPVTEQQLQSLSQSLWSWDLCSHCKQNQTCGTDECSSRRIPRLTCYFKHYRQLTSSYEPSKCGNAAFRTHNDFISVICQLRDNVHLPRTQLTKFIFKSRPDHEHLPLADQECIIDLAVKAMTMVNCSNSRQSWELLEHGPSRVPWRSEVSFSAFFLEAFPLTDYPSLNSDSKSPLDIKPFLMARKLKKRLGLKFRATDDLRRHLKLDRKANTLEIFHHTAFLKEHLRLTNDKPRTLSLEESLRWWVQFPIVPATCRLRTASFTNPRSNVNTLYLVVLFPVSLLLNVLILFRRYYFHSQT